jgi:hypothetical protein
LKGGHFEKCARDGKMKLIKVGSYNKLRIVLSVRLFWVLVQFKICVHLPENYSFAVRKKLVINIAFKIKCL